MSKRFLILISAASLIGAIHYAEASAFQVWEQDAGSIGNYHAGRAAIAEDASTSFYNPAGLLRIKNQEFVVGGNAYETDLYYRGNLGSAQGGRFYSIPFGHYAAPINDCVVFGFSAVFPFKLLSNYYGANTDLRVLDLSPTLGVAINEKFSIGAGVDFEHASVDITHYVPVLGQADAFRRNSVNGNSNGYHAGLLYQFDPQTRLGLSYQSKVVYHLTGHSYLTGPINGSSHTLYTNLRLPPSASLSFFHALNRCWDVMATVTYTQWRVFKNLILQNAVQSTYQGADNNLAITVLEGYRNAWNYAVGANYHVNEKLMLRTGLGFDQSAVASGSRTLRLPDSDRAAIALGAHFQADCAFGFDAGWTHIFGGRPRINNGTTQGSVRTAQDVIGIQVKWDIL